MCEAITVTGIKKHYDGGHIRALDGVTLTINAGEYVAIVGPSGSGKSTLLNMLAALDTPDTGQVVVHGTDLQACKDLAQFRRQTIGYVFQLHNLIPTLTAWENVQIPLMELPISARERKGRAMELLERVGMAHRANNLPTKMSGGERQRVAIARALVNDPQIIIADEPTGSVDSQNSSRILDLLEQVAAEGQRTLVLVTHDREVAARARRLIRVLDGQVVEDSLQAEAI